MEVATEPSAVTSRPSPERGIAAYVLSWGGAAILVALGFLAFASDDRRIPLESAGLMIALFFAVTTAAEAVVLHLQHGKSKEFLNLSEAAIAINILLFEPRVALAITLAGMALANLLHRRAPIKLAFNLAQYTVSTCGALTCFMAIAGGSDALSPRGLTALAVGMAVFGVTNAAAVSGVVARLDERSFRSVLRDSAYVSALTVFGNTAVGIVAAVVWHSRPGLTVLMLAPAITLHLAYRGVVRSVELLEQATAERDRLNRIIVGASDGIVLVDRDGHIDVWSPAMAQLTGIPEDEAKGQSLAHTLTGRDGSNKPIDPLEPLRCAGPGSPVKVVEMLLAHRERGDRIVRARHNALFDSHGAAVGDAILVHDVTHDHEIERLKDDLLARVSHELRTPLTPIKGYAQALLRKVDRIKPKMMEDALKQIVDRADHMTLLIDDLLLVSRIMAGRASLGDQIRPDAVDLPELCASALKPFRMMEPERTIELLVEDDFPIVVADPIRVEQILANLVSNACKYSEKGEPVGVELRSEEGGFALSVSDRGRGIPSDQIEKVFERFYRLENPLTMTTGGIGLGLHITREFAHAMGGTLTATSRLGEGSRFTLRLPHAPASASVSEPSCPGRAPSL